jgi:hypothetical protein
MFSPELSWSEFSAAFFDVIGWYFRGKLRRQKMWKSTMLALLSTQHVVVQGLTHTKSDRQLA